MIELQRPILPPPSGASSPSAGLTLATAAAPRPVEPAAPAAPARELAVWHGNHRPQLDGDAAEPAESKRGRRWVDAERLSGEDPAERGQARAGRLAFLAQQIYQEAMPTGLHLEPWAEGIGAYRLAGAEPVLESAVPAVVRFSV